MNTHIVRVNEKIEKIENMIKESFGEEKVIVLSNNDNFQCILKTDSKLSAFFHLLRLFLFPSESTFTSGGMLNEI